MKKKNKFFKLKKIMKFLLMM